MTPSPSGKLKEVFVRFLRLGTVGFGGGIAMLSYIEREFVIERKWLDAVDFHRFVAVAKLFPGPIGTLVSTRVGYERGGIRGGILAALGQILPAFVMILILAQVATTLDQIGALASLWRGLSLAAIAISLQAGYGLTLPLFRGGSPYRFPVLLTVIAITGSLTFAFPKLEAIFILASGTLALLWGRMQSSYRPREVASLGLTLLLFWTCFRASLFTFGSGIAMIPVLRTFFIDQHHWVNSEDFLRGLTIGQVTPGPLVIVATYLGFRVDGISGAIATTVGTFLPTVIFGVWLMPKFESVMLDSPKLKSFFDGLLPAVCGAIFGAMIRLMLLTVAVDDQVIWGRVAITVILTALAIFSKLGPLWLFAIGGAAAYFVS